MDLRSLLEPLDGGGQLVDVREVAPREARHGAVSRPLPGALAAEVERRPLWSHQAAAIDLIRAGTPTVVATGTASGKSLCFLLPVAEACGDDGAALVVYPTKALAHDQLRAIEELDLPGVVASTYDGDADPDARSLARRRANVVLTNPEMVHYAICANHDRWHRLLGRLRYIVVDELHAFRGVFGSHVAHVLRRLVRLCRHYGADPVLVATTATTGRPDVLAARLLGTEVAVVDDDGSPCGTRTVALWDPAPAEDPAPESESARVAGALVESGSRVIAFCRSRWAAEVTAEAARERVGPLRSVRAYRGGYLAGERREIELELAAGEIDVIAATNALELGIDVGALDAAVLCGFPGTVASFWQQVGRAGRGADKASAVLVAGRDQLDRWFLRHPDELFSRPPEPAVVDPANPYVLLPHLAAGAVELALRPDDERHWGEDLHRGVRQLVGSRHLAVRNGRATWSGSTSPAHRISLRSTGPGEIVVTDAAGDEIGTVDHARAPFQVHPGARYLHQGRAWRVVSLDQDEGRCVVEPDDSVGHRVRAVSTTEVDIVDRVASTPVGPARLELGTVTVTGRVVGYVRRDAAGAVVEEQHLDLAPVRLATTAVWWAFDTDLASTIGIDGALLPGALHAAEHALIGMLPLVARCDRWDVGGVSSAHHPGAGGPVIFVHDGHPGGIGVAPCVHGAAADLVTATASALTACGCSGGCPACVVSPKCGSGNHPLDKGGALALLRALG